MEEYRESNSGEGPRALLEAHRWLVVAAVALLCLAGIAFAYGAHQHALVNQLTTQASTSNAQMNTLQEQVNTLTAKLNQLTATTTTAPAQVATAGPESADTVSPETPDTTPAAPPTPAKPAHAKHPVHKKTVPVDSKYTKLQAQLDEQQKELKETQEAMAKDRADLQDSINSTRADLSSTRDDLNGSIARTHEELVVLEKRGERAFFEFDLSKSKQSQRVGPVTISLRKADTKHKTYDLAMVVDDNELNKKKVNLYEPIWMHTENDAQPVQIVVNRIDKDMVHGYVSAPKYKPSELAAAGSATVTPVSSRTPATSPNPPDSQQPPPQQPPTPQPEL